MMISKKLLAVTAAMVMAGFSVQADTGIRDSASTTIRIQGYVPVICRVNLSTDMSVADSDGIANLGTANEFCNAPRGYRVVVQHPTDLQGAALISNGERIPLSPSGETVITDSAHAAIRTVALAADLGDEPELFRSISVRIEAKA